MEMMEALSEMDDFGSDETRAKKKKKNWDFCGTCGGVGGRSKDPDARAGCRGARRDGLSMKDRLGVRGWMPDLIGRLNQIKRHTQ